MHPFQHTDLAGDPRWQEVVFDDARNAFFEEQAQELEQAFRSAVQNGGLRGFVKTYVAIAEKMLATSEQSAALAPVLQDALLRLVRIFYYLRHKTRSSFETETSICSWDLDPELVRQAAEAAAVQERDAVARRDYDLASDPDLRAWLMANVRPVIEEYVGCRAIEPWGVIRYANASGEGEPWPSYEAKHAYEEFHFDELCYMQRIILYLNDVDEGCGPFLYVDGSDRMEQNLVVRTFHQAVDACGSDFYTEVGRRAIARLPGLFRGSDIVGRHTGPGPFESSRLVQATGPAGRLILFDGFQLVHAGGFPATATRKALFIAFRFPRKKVGDLAATAVRRLTARKFARWAG